MSTTHTHTHGSFPSKMGFPGGWDSKGSTCNLSSIPGSGRSPGGGHGNPLQYSCLENTMDRGGPGALQSMGVQRVGHDWNTLAHTHTHETHVHIVMLRAPVFSQLRVASSWLGALPELHTQRSLHLFGALSVLQHKQFIRQKIVSDRFGMWALWRRRLLKI